MDYSQQLFVEKHKKNNVSLIDLYIFEEEKEKLRSFFSIDQMIS